MAKKDNSKDQALAIIPEIIEGELVDVASAGPLHQAGQTANEHAARGVFVNFLNAELADNTIRRHAADLALFADYLEAVGESMGAGMAEFSRAVASWHGTDPARIPPNPDAWRGVTWGLIEGFRNWMGQQGYATGSINVRLSAVKKYASLATKAGAIDAQENALIRLVQGYRPAVAKRVDERRDNKGYNTRIGAKKAQHVSITDEQAKQLKQAGKTAQEMRDSVIMCLLLDHGLRVGELAGLKVSDVDLKSKTLNFYRPKVDKQQTHKLSADSMRALRAWFDSGNVPMMADQPLLRASRKGGKLTEAGMSERCITDRVRVLGELVGLAGLSAHDCRHYWTTYWSQRLDKLPRGLFQLQEAGGWNSPAMPRRYAEESKIANDGMDPGSSD